MKTTINIVWWADDGSDEVPENHKNQLMEHALKHITPLILDGYISGQLRCEIDDINYYAGSWSIGK